MLNQRLNAARAINAQLQITERAIDNAVTEAAALAACMPRARMEANIAAEVGHAALERSAAAFAALIRARGEIIAAHQELSTVKGSVGLGAMALGGSEYKGAAEGVIQAVRAA